MISIDTLQTQFPNGRAACERMLTPHWSSRKQRKTTTTIHPNKLL